MRRLGRLLLIIGLIGVCIKETITACLGTILGSIILEIHAFKRGEGK